MKCKTNFMKSNFLIAAAFFTLLTGSAGKAQQESNELKLSLREAQDYALGHNKMVLNAKSDIQASKAAMWETISAALPQVRDRKSTV